MAGLTVAEMLRLARGERSLRSVARAAGVVPSTLSRYERGTRTPSGDIVGALDRALGLDGGLVALSVLQTSGLASRPPAQKWEHLFPAKWDGRVWIEVVPTEPGRHDMTLRWGPWEYSTTLEVPTTGMMLLTSKAESATPAPLSVGISPAAVLRFGVGDASKCPHSQVIDHGWEPVEPSDLMRTAGALLADALTFCGRTPDELAEFLGVPLANLQAFLSGRPMSLG